MDDILSHQGIAAARRAAILSSGGTSTTAAAALAQTITYPIPRLIGVGGYKRHGKDTLAAFMEQNHGWARMGMSDALHAFLMAQNPTIVVSTPVFYYKRGDDGRVWVMHLNAGNYSYAYLTGLLGYEKCKDEIPAYRDILKTTGTEAGRQTLWEDIWIRKAEETIRHGWAAGKHVVVTGIRFPNEIELIRRLGGLAVWITREGYETPQDSHASENSLNPEDFDFELTAADLDTLEGHAFNLATADRS